MNMKELAERGLPLNDVLIIDCHSHIGHWQHFNVPRGSAEGMLISMDSLGIDTACVTAHASIGPDYIYGNNMVMKAAEKFPDRFAGYITVNPNYPEDIRNELDRGFSAVGMIGMKLHPACHGRPMDHKNYHIVYEAANNRKCIVLIHVWGKSSVNDVDRIAGSYPDASFIMGHAGADIDAMELAVDVVGRHDNVYVDLAISRVREGNVEWFVKEMGSDKILFGTHMPFFDPRPCFGRLVYSDISDIEKRNIFGLNMERLLNRYRTVKK